VVRGLRELKMIRNYEHIRIKVIGLALAEQATLLRVSMNKIVVKLCMLIQDKLNKNKIKAPYSSFLEYGMGYKN